MNKAVKIFLFSTFAILSLVGFVMIAAIYELVQLDINPTAFATYGQLVDNICHFSEGKCNEAHTARAWCYFPFLSLDTRTDCFHEAIAELNIKFYPELVNPTLTQEQITAWSHHAAQDIVNFDYKNLDERLSHIRTYFTPAGWVSFSKALNDANIIEAVKSRKMAIELVPEGNATIKKAYVAENAYTWMIEFPVIIPFKNADPSDHSILPHPIKTDLLLQIARSPWAQNPDGVGIVQWVTGSEKAD